MSNIEEQSFLSIFVTGASRSGTTMMSRVLGNHSKILALNELHYFGDLVDPYKEGGILGAEDSIGLAANLIARQEKGIWGDGPEELEREIAETIIGKTLANTITGMDIYEKVVMYFAHESKKEGACEQTPRNIFYAKQLLDYYPSARVVHMLRDPRAVIASQKNRWRLRKLSGKHVPISEVIRTWFNYHPFTMCRLWSRATEAANALENHPRFMVLKFEDLVSDPSHHVSRVCHFLGVDFEESMLDVPRWGSSNQDGNTGKKGITSDVQDAWKDILSVGELNVVENRTGPFMDRLGYERHSSNKVRFVDTLVQYLRYPLHVLGVALSNPKRAWIQLRALISGAK